MTSGGKREGAGRKKIAPKVTSAPVGRPPLDPDCGESLHVCTRLGKTDHRALMTALKQRGLQPGVWMRAVVLDALHLILTQENHD